MNDNKSWKMLDNIWQTIKEGYESYKAICPKLLFHDDKKNEFNKLYQQRYNEIKERFMTDDTRVLDSHKQAALLTICCLQLEIIEYSDISQDDDELYIIPQMIAISVGLSYMLQCLNDLLQTKNINIRIKRYYFPIALACNTEYEKIMCRILFQEQHEQDMSFNVLELADRYFLLEYINLLQHGIEPTLLKETESH